MKLLLVRLKCWTMGHDWTCKANLNIPPTQEQADNGISGFWDYSKMYCGRCGKLSELNHK